MSEYLFACGTLRPGLGPPEAAGLIRRWRYVGPAQVRGHLYDLGEYPGAILDASSEAKVSGDVFELPDDQSPFAALDAYEGYDSANPEGSLFRRTKSLATLADGREFECWVYVYNRVPTGAPLIESGDYAEWQSRKINH